MHSFHTLFLVSIDGLSPILQINSLIWCSNWRKYITMPKRPSYGLKAQWSVKKLSEVYKKFPRSHLLVSFVRQLILELLSFLLILCDSCDLSIGRYTIGAYSVDLYMWTWMQVAASWKLRHLNTSEKAIELPISESIFVDAAPQKLVCFFD